MGSLCRDANKPIKLDDGWVDAERVITRWPREVKGGQGRSREAKGVFFGGTYIGGYIIFQVL